MSDSLGLKELEKLNLPDNIFERVKQARIEAQSVIEHLEPEHISSWADLIRKLEVALEKAKKMQEYFSSSLP